MARILIAEADRILNDMMSRQLEAHGHEVVSAIDGLDALGRIYSDKFDLVLIDVVLPRINGALLLKSIKKRSEGSVILIVSASDDIEMAVDSLRNGAFDIIRKPFDGSEFHRFVEGALDEWRSMKNAGYVYRDSRRKDNSFRMRGIVRAITDSILVAAAFCIGFLSQEYLFESASRPLFVGSLELLRLSLGLGFCHAFVFVYDRSYRTDLIDSGRQLAGRLWRNLTLSYAIFLAMIFLTNGIGFSGGRGAIVAGYVLGLIFLCLSRFIVIPYLSSGTWREGRKSIIIAQSGKDTSEEGTGDHPRPVPARAVASPGSNPAPEADVSPFFRLVNSIEDIHEAVMDDRVKEIHIACDALSADEIAGLLDQFGNRKMKITLLNDRVDIGENSGVQSTET